MTIGQELAAFLEEGLSIHVGTRDGRLHPHGARAAAAIVSADGTEIVVYISTIAAARLLPDLEDNRQAAVVFCRPTDDRACQVKGEFAGVRPAEAAERPMVASQWKRFLEQLARIGIPEAIAERWVFWPAVAVRLRVTALFEQTPGPKAGAPLP